MSDVLIGSCEKTCACNDCIRKAIRGAYRQHWALPEIYAIDGTDLIVTIPRWNTRKSPQVFHRDETAAYYKALAERPAGNYQGIPAFLRPLTLTALG